MSEVLLAPSLLAANQADLRASVECLRDHVEVFHIDVMDGHFVPNISMGPGVVRGVRPLTELPLDVHLMVSDPDQWVPMYRDAGADWISVHAEATVHLERSLSFVREVGARAGVALNPATPFQGLEYALQPGDFVVAMTVNPGFGGQRFIASAVDKIAALRAHLDAHGLDAVAIEVDGGVGPSNAAACAAAGATILVAGSAIVGAPDPVAAAASVRAQAVGVHASTTDC